MSYPTIADIPLEVYIVIKKKKMKKSKEKLRATWFEYFGNKCFSCECEMHCDISKQNELNFATVDHILARCLGGDNNKNNKTIICRGCNYHKSRFENAIKFILMANKN